MVELRRNMAERVNRKRSGQISRIFEDTDKKATKYGQNGSFSGEKCLKMIIF